MLNDPYRRLAQRHDDDAECKRLWTRYEDVKRTIQHVHQTPVQNPGQTFTKKEIAEFISESANMVFLLARLVDDTKSYMRRHIRLDEQPQDGVDS